MDRSRVRVASLAAVGLLVVSAAGAAAAVPGDPFRLGVANSISAATTLSGSLAARLVGITNTSTLAGARALTVVSRSTSGTVLAQNQGTGPALQLSVAAGRPPLTVNSTAGKATNLNADKLDGQDSSAFLPTSGKAADSDSLDGLDASAFVRGGGYVRGDALALSPSSVGIVLDTSEFRILYGCPSSPEAGGSVMLVNMSDETVNYFADDGSNPNTYGSLAAGDMYTRSVTYFLGDRFTFSVQGSFIATIEVFFVHRIAPSFNCHVQALATVYAP
jgi:hypothetical protein